MTNLLKILLLLFLLTPLSFIPNLVVFPFPGNPLAKYYFFCVISGVLLYFSFKIRITNYFLFFPILFGYLFEIIRNPIVGGINILTVMGWGILLVGTFCCIVLILNQENRDSKILKLQVILKPYYYLCNFIVIFGVVVYILIFLKFINIEDWPLHKVYGYEFSSRLDHPVTGFNPNYYVTPFYFSVLQPNYIKLPFPFDLIGTNCGIFIEPHVNCFFVTPSLFLINFFKKTKYGLILKILYIIFIVLSLSTTNLLVFSFVIFIGFIKNIFKNKWKLIFIIPIAIVSVFISRFEIVQEVFNLIEYKSTSSSNETSSGYIEHILTPETFFGTGILVIPSKGDDFLYNEKIIEMGDVGFVGFFLFVSHYFLIFLFSFRNIFLKPQFESIGLATLYFGLHSLKIPIHTMQYPLIIFFLFVISLTINGTYRKTI